MAVPGPTDQRLAGSQTLRLARAIAQPDQNLTWSETWTEKNG